MIGIARASTAFTAMSGWYSGSALIVVGAVALMLEVDPALTADQVRTILRSTAVADDHTGALPNADWGFGKLDIYEAVSAAVNAAMDVLFDDGFESDNLGSSSAAADYQR